MTPEEIASELIGRYKSNYTQISGEAPPERMLLSLAQEMMVLAIIRDRRERKNDDKR